MDLGQLPFFVAIAALAVFGRVFVFGGVNYVKQLTDDAGKEGYWSGNKVRLLSFGLGFVYAGVAAYFQMLETAELVGFPLAVRIIALALVSGFLASFKADNSSVSGKGLMQGFAIGYAAEPGEQDILAGDPVNPKN